MLVTKIQPLATAPCQHTMGDPRLKSFFIWLVSSSVFSNPTQYFLQLGQVVLGDGPPVSTLTLCLCVCKNMCVLGGLGELHNEDIFCSAIWGRGGMGVKCYRGRVTTGPEEQGNSFVTVSSQNTQTQMLMTTGHHLTQSHTTVYTTQRHRRQKSTDSRD